MFSATSSISLDTQSQVYDFKSEENALKWQGLFKESLGKVLSQLHINLTAREEALEHVESLILQLLMVLAGKPMPHTVQDVEDKVEKTFPNPINKWAIKEARGVLEKGKKKSVELPVEKVHNLLVKEVFQHKIDFQVSLYIVAVLEYIAADILNLAGKYKKNIHHVEHHAITTQDIKTAISADQVLMDMFEQDDDVSAFSAIEDEPVTAINYDEAVKEIILEEKQYMRDLNLILKVFKVQIERTNQTTPRDMELIFSNLSDVYECTATVLGQLEDTLEMTDDGWHLSVGSCFEELAEDSEFDVYEKYTTDVLEPQCREHLSSLLEQTEIYNRLGTAGHGFREAVKYVLPKLLLLPVAHVLKYFDNIKMLCHLAQTEDDREVLEQAQGMLKPLQTQLERIVSNSGVTVLPRRKAGDPPARNNRSLRQASLQKMNEVQRSIDGWEGKDISQCGCSEFVKEGVLGKVGSGRKLTERHVFLFDGLIVLCKPNSRRSSVTGPVAEFRLKEKFQIRKVEIKDREDSDDLRFTFEIAPREQSSVILFAKTAQDKNEWMASLIMLNTKSMLDRSLDMILLDEEKKNPLRLPDPELYPFAEPDSPENIVLEQPESGGVPLIKGATLTKLTERLTYHMYADPMFVRTFLTTFRSFCTAQELLTLLLKRYNIPEPAALADQSPTPTGLDTKAVKATLRDDNKRFRKEYSQPVKFRVLNVLRHWVDHHFYDFERDQKLLLRLESFLTEIRGKVMRKWAESITKIIQRKKKRDELKPEVVFGVDRSPPPTEWHVYKSEDDWKHPPDDSGVMLLLLLHPIEVARQLTLLEFDLYRAVKPAELVGSVWTKENKQQASPNLLRMIHHNTNVTRWLEKCVVDTDNIDERRAVVSRIIEIMVVLQELNNFSGVLEVVAALDSAAVHRLTLTFEEIVPKLDRALEEARELCHDHYKKYQEKLRSINPPCVPFFGMYLTNILHIDEGNPDFLPKSDRLINFSKRRKVAEITGEIQQYQNQPYCLKPVPKIRSFLESLRPFEEGKETEEINNYLYTRSLTIEPRGCRVPPKFPRQWDGISLRSPGIKARRSNVPHPLPSMRHTPSRIAEEANNNNPETPRVLTPPTPSTPCSPPHTANSDNSVFAPVVLGTASSNCSSGYGTLTSLPPPLPPPLPPRRKRELSLADVSARVQQAPDAPELPPRNSSPPPRPPRRDQTLPRMHSASLLHAHFPPDVPPPRRNSSVDSPPLPPPPPATLPRRLPVTGDPATDPFSRMGMDRGAVRSASPSSGSRSARDPHPHRNHFNFNFAMAPPLPAAGAGPQLPPKPYRQTCSLTEPGGAP
ncbi:son of sevenless homolog 2-like isoform X2 [Amphibalanus amphitrite]|uniref:son of sevenless homolog 2-like isoform X2 n=1 Tax=Amphibalanus amphitrite TaxID=1232801 RepID=UPI001C91FD89|nr:son of sevenless homolog 2-like isoform X2 [Amphibalanus amphitrite]